MEQLYKATEGTSEGLRYCLVVHVSMDENRVLPVVISQNLGSCARSRQMASTSSIVLRSSSYNHGDSK